MRKYVEDERLAGKCPLPRPRLAEITAVLKAIATLLQSLKKAPQASGKCGIDVLFEILIILKYYYLRLPTI